jgi:hypothetical protein
MRLIRISVFAFCAVFTGAKGYARQPAVSEKEVLVGQQLEWRTGGPKRWLGKSSKVEVPIEVIAAASSVLGADYSAWGAKRDVSVNDYGKEVVILSSASGYFVCLVLPDRWVRLNSPGGMKGIDYIEEKVFKSLSEMKDSRKAEIYLNDVSYLYKGDAMIPLTQHLKKWQEKSLPLDPSPFSSYLWGKEKDPDKLKELCWGPIIEVKGTTFVIRCNLLNGIGGVEKWVLTGKFESGAKLKDILITDVCPAGTFGWPLVD